MAGKEIFFNNIGQEKIRKQTAMWLMLKRGPDVSEETIDFYAEKASRLLNCAIEISQEIGIPPEIVLQSLKESDF